MFSTYVEKRSEAQVIFLRFLNVATGCEKPVSMQQRSSVHPSTSRIWSSGDAGSSFIIYIFLNCGDEFFPSFPGVRGCGGGIWLPAWLSDDPRSKSYPSESVLYHGRIHSGRLNLDPYILFLQPSQ